MSKFTVAGPAMEAVPLRVTVLWMSDCWSVLWGLRPPPDAMLIGTVVSRLAGVAAVPEMPTVPLFGGVEMQTSSAAPGTPFGDQLAAVFQAEPVVPIQVLSLTPESQLAAASARAAENAENANTARTAISPRATRSPEMSIADVPRRSRTCLLRIPHSPSGPSRALIHSAPTRSGALSVTARLSQPARRGASVVSTQSVG